MPHFALQALDKAVTGTATRAANRAAHLEWAGSLGEKLVLAGPLIAGDGESMVGSLLILDAESEEAVRALSVNDPYVKAGLFEVVTIKQVKFLIGGDKLG